MVFEYIEPGLKGINSLTTLVGPACIALPSPSPWHKKAMQGSGYTVHTENASMGRSSNNSKYWYWYIYGIPQYLVLKQKQITRRQKKYNVFPKRFYNTEGLDDIEMQGVFFLRLPAGMRSL